MFNLKNEMNSMIPEIHQIVERFITSSPQTYETFGKDVEVPVVDYLLSELKKRTNITNYKKAAHKNDFPELAIEIEVGNKKQWIAIDVKSSNHSAYKKGKWIKNNSPGNDLGSFKTLPEHIEKYGGENIHYLWVHYNFNEEVQELVKVEFDSFYRFIGETKGIIKYRISDGKIRPRLYSQKPFYENFIQFERAFAKGKIERSKKNIVREFIELKKSGVPLDDFFSEIRETVKECESKD